jgi:hypothetical protein
VIFKDTLPDRFFLCLCVQARPIVAQLSSTTYYVSSSLGDDGNNGLSPHSPLASIARVNALSLLPGDRVSQVYDLFFYPRWRAEAIHGSYNAWQTVCRKISEHWLYNQRIAQRRIF